MQSSPKPPVDKTLSNLRPTNLQPSSQPAKGLLFLLVAYACLFLLTLWLAYHNRLPLTWLSQFPNYDKVGHLVLYCIPSFLGHRLFRRKHWRLRTSAGAIALPVFPVLFGIFTVVEELTQGFSPHRTLDGLDMVCSVVGIVCGYALAQRGRIKPWCV